MAKSPGKSAPGETPPPPASDRRAGLRGAVVLPVRLRYDSVLDFVDTQSMNISRTGMFIATDEPPAVGSMVDFEFGLSDGFTLLRGTAEVVRVVRGGAVSGMGIRFVDLDDSSRRLIDRIVDVNAAEGRNSTLTFDFSRPATAAMPVVSDPLEAPAPVPSAPVAAEPVAPLARPVAFEGRNLRIVLSSASVHVFTQNPLLNVRTGGLFVPAEEDVPLGTVFQVEIADAAGGTLISSKGKVVAKQELRIGIRLADADKDALARLRAEVGKLVPTK